MTELDPAAVMAEHQQVGEICAACMRTDKDGNVDVCRWPCLPYRLAEALATERAKVARVEALAQEWEVSSQRPIDSTALDWQARHAFDLRVALAEPKSTPDPYLRSIDA